MTEVRQQTLFFALTFKDGVEILVAAFDVRRILALGNIEKMIKINRRSALKSSAACVAAAGLPRAANAQSSFSPPSYTVNDLKGQLTPFGGIKAGNADGTIPAWTGGGVAMPTGYQQGDPRPIPFADEKPILVITGKNFTQYQDKLNAGVIALLQKHPDFRLDVYPTHRTAIAPQYVYDYIYKNASTARLSPDGNAVTGAYGGIPFPIPRSGHEVMWNHELAWAGNTVHFVSDAHLVTPSGETVLEARASCWVQYSYYVENGEASWNGCYSQRYILPTAPPYEAGAAILQWLSVNPYVTPIEGWEYLVGERRVRRAPELQYDTPNTLSGGVQNWDEDQIFFGKLDRYDFEYMGFKEMYVPYNCNKAWTAPIAIQMLPNFLNPDLIRWELHRMRVVEARLKPGARNVDARRTFYADEDTGWILLGDVYDAQGTLYKFNHTVPAVLGDVPCMHSAENNATYDLHAGDYFFGDHYDAECSPQWKTISPLPASYFTPGQLSASAGGF